MANKTAHAYVLKVNGKTYTLQFSNAGHRASEDFLGETGDLLQERVGNGRLGHRVLTALMWGATRKNHRRDLPEVDDIDDLMDDLNEENEGDDTGEKALQNFVLPLMAAYTRRAPEELDRMMKGEEPSTNGEAPKDQDKPARKLKAAEKEESA